MNEKYLVVRPLITSNSNIGWVATKEQHNESEINQSITNLFTQKWFSIMQTLHFCLSLTPKGVKKTLILVKTRQIQSWRVKLFSTLISFNESFKISRRNCMTPKAKRGPSPTVHDVLLQPMVVTGHFGRPIWKN